MAANTMINSESTLKHKACHWADSFEVCCILDNNGYPDAYHQYDMIIAAGAATELRGQTGRAFAQLKAFYDLQPRWLFGLLSYDLKNETEDLQSDNADELQFPPLYFFSPQYLLAFKGEQVEVLIGDPAILQDITRFERPSTSPGNPFTLEGRINKETYIKQVQELQQHINRGNCYEVTFCQEFFARNAHIAPLEVYKQLNQVSPAPFAGYFKIYKNYILSASPERFLCKRGTQLISQPIKGTAKRGADSRADETIRLQFTLDEKEKTENVMIVDLVRNDLTKSAKPGSVKVVELFGIYSFPQVHQMISTISCELQPGLHFIDALKNTFPMGSMTGAPKIRAMQLIEEFESSKRGAYSGSIGYITPEGDFDFNVIIRSLLYQSAAQYLSFQVGGAITYSSDAAKEYEECLLKASAILKTLKGLHKQSF